MPNDPAQMAFARFSAEEMLPAPARSISSDRGRSRTAPPRPAPPHPTGVAASGPPQLLQPPLMDRRLAASSIVLASLGLTLGIACRPPCPCSTSEDARGRRTTPGELPALSKAATSELHGVARMLDQGLDPELAPTVAAVGLVSAEAERLPPDVPDALTHYVRSEAAARQEAARRLLDVIAPSLREACRADADLSAALGPTPPSREVIESLWTNCAVADDGLAPSVDAFSNAVQLDEALALTGVALHAHLRRRGGVEAVELRALRAMTASELAGGIAPAAPKRDGYSLPAAKSEFRTRVRTDAATRPPARPPAGTFELTHFETKLGSHPAFVSVPPRSKADAEGSELRRPAIIWLRGGWRPELDASWWTPQAPHEDHSAAPLREGPALLMIPGLRGVNGAPGDSECMLGEVEDVLAAHAYLAARPDVDPSRIYLGGHSTGATLALLVAESSDVFRAVVSVGPVAALAKYAGQCGPESLTPAEGRLRSPINFLDEIRTPTWIVEGDRSSNTRNFPHFEAVKGHAPIEILSLPGADHFDLLAPLQRALNEQIAADLGDHAHFEFDVEALGRAAVATHGGDPPA